MKLCLEKKLIIAKHHSDYDLLTWILIQVMFLEVLCMATVELFYEGQNIYAHFKDK